MAYKAPRAGEVSPVVTEAPSYGGTIETTVNHPAFGQISVSRISAGGAGVNLYDSDFGHNNFVRIEVKHSTMHRDLSRDWHHDREHIVHLDLSESQWATFVSSFNQGSGVPCTLNWIVGEGSIPGIPTFDRTEVFKKEMRETTNDAVDSIKELIAAVADTGLSKKKQDELLAGANRALRALTSSIPFVQDQFDEHVETTVERGMQEIHGYMNAAINRAGIAALQGGVQNGENRDPILLNDISKEI
jgi:hypothetical protein